MNILKSTMISRKNVIHYRVSLMKNKE